MADELFHVDDKGLHLHPHRFQWQTMQSQSRVVIDLKGWRGGFCGRFDVLMADGSRRFVSDIQAGDVVHSLDEATLKITTGCVSRTYQTGVQPTFLVKTASGREITVTGKHPFFGVNGWVPCENLQVGDYVGVPRSLPDAGNEHFDRKWMKLMGYFLGDGGLTHSSVMFTNINQEILDDLASCLPDECEMVYAADYSYRIRKRRLPPSTSRSHHCRNAPKNTVLEFARHHGIDKLAKDKTIPDFVFRLQREDIAPMLNSLFACDGWVDERGVGYCSASKQMARDVQHLLLRFGIVSRLRHKDNQCWNSPGKKLHIWFVTVQDYQGLFRFAEHIGITSKQEKLLALLRRKESSAACGNPTDVIPKFPRDKFYDVLPYTEGARGAKHRSGKARNYTDRIGYGLLRNSRQPTVKRRAAQRIADHFGFGKTLAFSDIYWDKIKSIEPLGEQETFDIEVEGHHNFIAEDIFVHNSSFAPFWLKQEMERCGPGNSALNYFCAIPTLQAAKKGIIPYVRQVFETYYELATFNKNDNVFFTTPAGERRLWGHEQKERTPINVVYADDPTSFGSMTSLGGIADEIGQAKFKLESWRTLMSRMATTKERIGVGNVACGMGFPKDMTCGRMLAGSTVWNLGWLEDYWNEYRSEIHAASKEYVLLLKAADRGEEREQIKADFRRQVYLGLINKRHFIRFDSTANPAFPPSEFEEMRKELPDWFFDMRYRALFRKPAGLIFEDWQPSKHVVDPFDIPKHWPREVGVDFGKRNFFATIWARDPETGRHFLITSYHDATKSNAERAQDLLKLEPALERAVAGQISEEDERIELSMGGLRAIAPRFKSLWAGINGMAALIRTDKVYVLRGACDGFLDEVRQYSRSVDERGNVDLDSDPQDKDTFHFLDSVRYYLTWYASQTAAAHGMAGGIRVRAGDKASLKQTAEKLESTPVVIARAASGLRAGGGMHGNLSGTMRAQRYGMDAGCLEEYLD